MEQLKVLFRIKPYILKLLSGEEVIGYAVDTSIGKDMWLDELLPIGYFKSINMIFPFEVSYDEEGNIMFYPMVEQSRDNSFLFQGAHVLTLGEPFTDVMEQYKKFLLDNYNVSYKDVQEIFEDYIKKVAVDDDYDFGNQENDVKETRVLH